MSARVHPATDADVSLALKIQFAFAGLNHGARLALLHSLRDVHAALVTAAADAPAEPEAK